MEVCFPGVSDVTRVRTRRELPATVPATTTEKNTNETESNVTISILADVHMKKNDLTVAGITLHSFVEAKYLGLKRK